MTTDADQLEFLEVFLAVLTNDDQEALRIIETQGYGFALHVIRHLVSCFIDEADRDWWVSDIEEEMMWEGI